MATTPKHVVVAINPNAKFGSRKHVGANVTDALRAAGHRVTPLSEASFAELDAAARAALADDPDALVDRPDALVVVGGDGMVHLGVNLVAGTEIPLAIVASGTGNDMARGLGLPFDDPTRGITALVEALDREPRRIDALRVRSGDGTLERWVASSLSGGFDAIVNERANRMRRPRGASRYTIALLVELARLRPIPYRVHVDGSERTLEAYLIAVANNVSFGGGMRIAPGAVLDDGLLDLVTVAPLPKLTFLRLFPRVFAGTHVDHPAVDVVRAKKVVLDAPHIVAYADGERVAGFPLEIEVVPGALRVHA